jgi:hypothetical protein
LRPLPRLHVHEGERIRTYARGVLERAEVTRVVPTPLDVVTESLNLHPVQDFFDLASALPGLLAKIQRLKRKVLGAIALRERTVYVDLSQPRVKARFTHGHELGHRVLRGHHEYFGDDAGTMRPDVHDLLEAEANQFSAELLFQAEMFSEIADDSRFGLGVAIELADRFETSMHAAIRRYVESSGRACGLAMFGHFLVHPNGVPSMKVLYASESVKFAERYGPLGASLPTTFPIACGLGSDALAAMRGRIADGLVTDGSVMLEDTRRGAVEMNYEVFSNSFFSFALIAPKVRVRVPARVKVLALDS